MSCFTHAWRQPHFLRTVATGPSQGIARIRTNRMSSSSKLQSASSTDGILNTQPSEPAPLPLILLDVDGVINGEAKSWGKRTVKKYNSITYSTAVVDQINQWSRSNLVEIRWSTYWGIRAQEELAPAIKLDHFAVATKNPAECGPKKGTTIREAIFGVPSRKVIWIDDQIPRHLSEACDGETPSSIAKIKDLVFNSGLVLFVGPKENEGLEPKHFELANRFLNNQMTVSDITKANQEVIGTNPRALRIDSSN